MRPAGGIRAQLRQALESWIEHKTPARAAAIAFYSLSSLAPLSLLLVWVGTYVWEDGAMRTRLLETVHEMAGPQVAALVEAVLADASIPSGEAFLPTVLGILLFAFSATAVVAQLQDALRDIWGTPAKAGHGILGFLRLRLVSLALVGMLGVGLALSLALSIVVSAATASFQSALPAAALGLADLVVSAATLIALFAVVFRVLPDAHVPWRQAWLGGCVTAVLHLLGQGVVGAYVGRTVADSAWGAAGSLVVFLTWVYYSSLVFLYGAEVTCELSPPVEE